MHLGERGALTEAEAELTASGVATGPILDRPFFDSLLLVRGQLRLAQGRCREAAADLVELHDRRMRRGTASSPFIQTGVAAAHALAALAAGASERSGRGRSRPRAALGRAAPDRAGAAGALIDLGAALRRGNRRAEAREPLREGLELARRCGAAAAAKRAHDELQASGEKVRRYTPIDAESLTPSERRVAEMAATGMTNRQIAQTLFLTVKTIETHLGAAYDKLGIHSRRELGGALGESAGVG